MTRGRAGSQQWIEPGLPALVFALFRERRRVDDGRLQLARTGATLRSEFRGTWRRILKSPRTILAGAGLGLALGFLGRPKAGRGGLLRSAAVLTSVLGNLRRRKDRKLRERIVHERMGPEEA
jgi:hypothetical protein